MLIQLIVCILSVLLNIYDTTSNIHIYLLNTSLKVGRHSSVGIATGYGLNGPGIEPQWGRDFPHLSRPALGSN